MLALCSPCPYLCGVQGVDFFQTEYDRLDRMLSSGKVGSSKTAEISKKLSVLGAFLEEKLEDVKEAVIAPEE